MVIGVAVAVLIAGFVSVHGLLGGSVATAAKETRTAQTVQTTKPTRPTTTTATPAPAKPLQLATAVYDLRTSTFRERDGENTPFAAESLTKLLIAMDMSMSARLSGPNIAKMQQMLSTSDDQIANQLWASNGGPQIVTRTVRTMGLTHTVAPTDPGRWGDTMTTAADIVRVYQYLMTSTPPAQRAVVLAALGATTQRAVDSTDQFFGVAGVVPMGQRWVKQAWACCRPAWDVHTSGIIGPDQRYVVVVLSQQSLAAGLTGASKYLTGVVKQLVTGL